MPFSLVFIICFKSAALFSIRNMNQNILKLRYYFQVKIILLLPLFKMHLQLHFLSLLHTLRHVSTLMVMQISTY